MNTWTRRLDFHLFAFHMEQKLKAIEFSDLEVSHAIDVSRINKLLTECIT